MNGCTSSSIDKEYLTATIIALEKKALEMWNNGNPSGFLELSSNDVVYIDPFFEKKLEGKEELRSYYDKIRGQIKVDTYEMIQPVVQLSPEMAVLTYNLTSYSGDEIYRWNCTEVYRLNSQNEWKIIHTHWSFIQPNK